jgi:hypothetical protein
MKSNGSCKSLATSSRWPETADRASGSKYLGINYSSNASVEVSPPTALILNLVVPAIFDNVTSVLQNSLDSFSDPRYQACVHLDIGMVNIYFA